MIAHGNERKISSYEKRLGVNFSASYHQFLFEQGTATIAGYTIIGIHEKEEKPAEVEIRDGWLDFERIKDGQLCPACGGSKDIGRITCYPCYIEYLDEARQQYVHIAIWIKGKIASRRGKRKKDPNRMSVVEAYQFLLRKRPDLKDKKLVPVCFKEDLNTGKQMTLCMDLSEDPKDDAPLVAILNINDRQTELVKHNPKFFGEWMAHLEGLVEKHIFFKAARRRIENRNNEVLKKAILKAVDKNFGQICPICKTRKRQVIVFEETQKQEIRLTCQECREEWLQLGSEKPNFAVWVQEKLRKTWTEVPCFTHKGRIKDKDDKEVKPNHIHIRAQDWHSRIFRVADYVVGLTAFRYNTLQSCLEVDAFWSGDLAGYVKGQAIRNLAIAVLSEANSLTGSLAIVFTRDIRENEKTGKIADRNWRRIADKLSEAQKQEAEKNYGRVSCPAPQELVEFAEANYILLSQAEQGLLSHQDGLNLFWAALGWPEHLQAKVDELEKKGYLTKQALASVIYSGIWSLQEAIWFFENSPRPEAVLLGSDTPEDRLYYTESLYWGRSAYLANLLKVKVSADLADGLSVEEREESDCELESYRGFWILKAVKDFNLPWMVKGSDPVSVKANEPVLILSVPCQTTQEANDLALIKEGFKALKQADSQARICCLIVSFEFSDLKYGMKVAEFMKENSRKLAERGVYLLFLPYRLDLLNDEVENRMFSARRKRQFPPRRTPLRLQLIEIPLARWQKPDLLYSVQDAQSAAYWIEKKIDLRLGRVRFRVNCNCVERIAVQDAEAKSIAVIDGQDSKTLLNTMASESGIIIPFVLPSKIPEFTEKAGGKLRSILKGVKGGLVAVATFEKSETSETLETAPTTAKACSVDSGFQFPVDPSDVDLANYAVKRHDEIARTHRQIQSALRTGEPLAVSYLRHEAFVEAIREYLLKKGKMELVDLRIIYNDGTEGQPFPLFCFPKRSKPEGLYQMRVGSISMRHAAIDLVTDGYLIQNVMISKRRLSSAEQEDYASRQTWHFLANFVDLLQHKRVKEITKDIRFRYLWSLLGLEGKKNKGCELHIFQTGLIPATVGIYRAVVKFLQERRGELVVVPRLIGKKADTKGEKTVDAEYLKATEWF